ncbi:hypothetical protein Tco_1147765, partial [Tanacetum coccineum]
MIKYFDNIALGQIMAMAIFENFLHTKPSIGYRFIFMLRKSTDFSEESVKKSWGKNRLMKAVRSSSQVSIVPTLSLSRHVFASPVSDRENIIRRTASFSVSVFKHIADFEEFMNVFMRIGFGSTIKLVSFDESQVVTFNGKF